MNLNVIDPQQTPRELYLDYIRALYPYDYTNPLILQHIQLLKDKQPNALYKEFETFLYNVYNMTVHELDWETGKDTEYNYYYNLFETQTTTQQLDARDFKTAKLLKSRAEGLAITISPPENYYKHYNELLAKAKTIQNSKYIKGGLYFIEFHTDGSKHRPHIHMYSHYDNTDKRNLGRIASYIRKKFPKVSVNVEKKADITYGLGYLEAKSSDAKKQLNKNRDYLYREKHKIPHVFKF